MTLQSRIRAITLAVVASTLAWPSVSAAQELSPRAKPAQAEGEAPADSGAAKTPEETVDMLLARLADPDEPDWEKVQSRILQLWSRSGSDSMDLLLNRAREAMKKGEMVKAIHHLSALLDHDPDFAEAWNTRATAFFMLDEYGQALADIEHVLALNPKHFGALTGLGLILDDMGREKEALVAFRAALKLNPHVDRVREAVERLAPKVDGRDI
jgi:tetratricopeptide (TPR) repeat protein